MDARDPNEYCTDRKESIVQIERTEYYGVYEERYATDGRNYVVVLGGEGKQVQIERYANKVEAAQRFDDLVTYLYGGFLSTFVSHLNFPDREITFGDIARADTLLHKACGIIRKRNQSRQQGIRYDESKDAARTKKWTAYLTLSMPRRSSVIGRYLTREEAIEGYNQFLDQFDLDMPRMRSPENE
jgi:hypothetical protein